jgi:hypothetical protein
MTVLKKQCIIVTFCGILRKPASKSHYILRIVFIMTILLEEDRPLSGFLDSDAGKIQLQIEFSDGPCTRGTEQNFVKFLKMPNKDGLNDI